MIALLFPMLIAAVEPFPIRKPPGVTCSNTTTCALVTNTGNGPAVAALSNGGTGIVGSTASGSYLHPGIEAESGNVTGSDAAAGFGLNYFALGAAPTYGALAYGGVNGLYGATENGGEAAYSYGSGVFGQDDGVPAAPDYNAGVLGASAVGTGVIGESNATPSFWGNDPIGLYAVADSNASQGAYGLVAETDKATALFATSNTQNTFVNLVDINKNMISAYNFTTGFAYFIVDDVGDAQFSGTLTTSKSTYVATQGTSGATHRMAVERDAAPQIEDVGEAQLTNGRAVVALDPALADSIDMRRPYRVFLTTYGDGNPLYVAQKTPAGFVVRESGGGRSTLAFAYRIVGKPFDENGRRFAAAAPLRAPDRTLFRRNGPRAPFPLSPEARLKQRLGTQGYAEALLAKRSLEDASR